MVESHYHSFEQADLPGGISAQNYATMKLQITAMIRQLSPGQKPFIDNPYQYFLPERLYPFPPEITYSFIADI
jgi:hypothetical protein